jgi:transcriptional regulator with XRE-family HTH domain
MSSTEKERKVLTPFGALIRAAREKHGWSLAYASERLHISKGYVHKLETATAQNPTIDMLANMSVVYGIDFGQITRLAAESSPDADYRMTLVSPRKKGK